MKLSIVIPAYNMENYLAKCLDSVIRPEIPDYEIIVVNDGSMDNTAAIAESYAERYPKLVRLISTENGGLGQARNVGLDAAVGEFLLFLDSDDYLADNAVAEICELLTQDFDICIFDFAAVNPKGSLIKRNLGCAKEGLVNLESYPELLIQAPAAWNKIFRRSLFNDSGIRFPGRVWFEDLRTIPKLYLTAANILSVRRTWYKYLLRPGSITNNKASERNLEIIAAVDDLIEFYRAAGKYEQYKPQLEYMAFYNQFLTSSTRVNLGDRRSPIQDTLMEDYIRKFPDYKSNPYIRSMSVQHKLLTALLLNKHRLMVNWLMRLNNLVKHKNA